MNRLQMLVKTIKSTDIDRIFMNIAAATGSSDEVLSSPYSKSYLVYVCITTTARAISQVPWQIFRLADGALVEEGPLVDLFQRPSFRLDEYSFKEAVVGHLLLNGNAWIVPFPPQKKVPDSLWVVGKRFIKPRKDPQSHQLSGWWYSPSGFTRNDRIELDISEAYHLWLWNPNDPILGQSPLTAGKIAVVSDYQAAMYNKLFFENSAVPEGVLSTDQRLTDATFERIKTQFQNRHQGLIKSHRVAILEQGLQYTPTGITHKDMEFLELRRYDRTAILQVFGMKEAVLSITNNLNYATAKEQKKEWWESTNLPLMRMFESVLNFHLLNPLGYRISFDITTIEALRESFDKKVKTAQILWQMGFTANEINQRLELGFDTADWRDTAYVPGAMLPVGEGKPEEEEQPKPEELPEQEWPTLLAEKLRGDQFTDPDFEAKVEKAWQRHIAQLEPIEQEFEKKVKRVFYQMRKKSLRLLNRKDVSDLTDEGFEQEKKELARLTQPLYDETAMKAFAGLASEIHSEIGIMMTLDLQDPILMAYLSTKTMSIQGVVDTVTQQMRNKLAEMASQGASVDQMADAIRGVFNVAANRAKTIARTEVNGAANFSRELGIRKSGFTKKVWFTALDERVRPTHVEMHGKTIEVDKEWTVGGASLQYPGDPTGPASEVINCFINPNLQVLTEKGWKAISRIKIGDRVLTHTGKFREVVRLPRERDSYDGEVIHLEVRSDKGVTVTPNHRFQMVDGTWKTAGEMKVGDEILVLGSYCARCGAPIPYWRKYCSRTCLSKDITDHQWHSDSEYSQNFVPVKLTKVDRYKLKHSAHLYNFAVDQDESYVVKGFVSHNCRCIVTVEPNSFVGQAPAPSPAKPPEAPTPPKGEELDKELHSVAKRFKKKKYQKLFQEKYDEAVKFFEKVPDDEIEAWKVSPYAREANEIENAMNFQRNLERTLRSILEVETPGALLTSEDSIYYNLVDWQTNTSFSTANVLRKVAHELEEGVAAPRYTKLAIEDTLEFWNDLTAAQKENLRRSYVSLRAFNQAYMERAYPNKVVYTLMRGADGRRGAAWATEITDYVEKEGYNPEELMYVHDTGLVGYTLDETTALGAGVERHGITATVEIPREEIVVHRDLLSYITNMFVGEEEFIVVGKDRAVPLKNLKVFGLGEE